MADFISGFWDLYVAGFVAFSLLLCLILMFANMTSQESGAPQLQGHVWDENLREYNNPLPRWWLILFVGTVLFSIVYLVIYPGFGNRKSTPENDAGLRREYAEEIRQAKAAPNNLEKYAGTQNLAALATDKDAMATGQRLFLTYCTQCHGSSGRGSKGYPNLTDNDWLYGSSPEVIRTSISEGRAGNMTPFKGVLSDAEIKMMADYVLALSKGKSEEPDYAQAKGIYMQRCVTCHGVEGKGSFLSFEATDIGAPNLTDDIWLFGGDLETIIDGIKTGHNEPMPAVKPMPTWKLFLDDAKLNLLAAYVYSLSKK